MTEAQAKDNSSLLDLLNLNYSIWNFKALINKYFKEEDSFAVCLFCINNFKHYNYRFGYEFGDMLLQAVFHKVSETIKDTGNVFRFGGDTLLILISDASDKDKLTSLLKAVTNTFDQLITVGDEALKVSINMGVSVYPYDSQQICSILKYAEIALDDSKKHSIEKLKFFDYLMYKEIVTRINTEADLVNAIRLNEFSLYYQPQINTKTMRVYGAEALLRWNHPKLGTLPPSSFIETIEQNGMINEIGRFVLEEACNQLVTWQKLGITNLGMSINISEKQLEDISFLDFLEDILTTTKVEAKYISMEITERLLLNPTEKTINILSAIRRKGIKIVIDDFGTRYSSLNYLFSFPVDGIKIDKSFTDKLLDSDKERIVLKNIIKLAHEINLDVVAEGVETKEQLKCMENINCHNIQGYIFGQPVSPDKFQSYLIKYNE